MAIPRFLHREVLPIAAMVAVECTNVGLSTIFKAATVKGLRVEVFMVYSYAISSVLLLPLCCLFHRKSVLPPLTATLLGRFFILGLLGFAAQFLGYKGIDYSSPTLNSAMSNLIPACTFVLAVLLRMERIAFRSLTSLAKIIGTVLSITGAFVVVLYKGPEVLPVWSDSAPGFLTTATSSVQPNWALGGALLAAEYALVSVWYVFQAKVVKEYPAEMVVVFFYNLFCCIIAMPVCLLTEQNWSSWKVAADVRMLSILYSGIIGSGFGIVVHTWGLHVRGPVYVALFRPLSIAIAAISGYVFLGDALYLGSVIGSVVVSMGCYIVMWGKMGEGIGDRTEVLISESSSSPLLEGNVHSANVPK